VIGITGEAGIGKTRLAWETSRMAAEEGFEAHEGMAVSFGRVRYGAIRGLLRRSLAVTEGASEDRILRRVGEEACRLSLKPVDRHHLADVLGVRSPDSPLEHLDGDTIRLNNAIAVRAYLAGVRRDLPRAVELAQQAMQHLPEENLLLRAIVEQLPEGPEYYPRDQVTDLYEREIAADLIREAALNLLRDEVPHGIAIRIDQFTERETHGAYIEATIFVERESHKGIVIGKGGSMLKQIGISARQEIERMSGRKVFIRLRVKVRKNWRNDERVLRWFGY
jgi:hypothetical protein